MQKVVIEYATDTDALKRAREELGLVGDAENALVEEFKKVNAQAIRQTELLEKLAEKGRKAGDETRKSHEGLVGILNKLEAEYKELAVARSRAEDPKGIRALTVEMEANRRKVSQLTGEPIKNMNPLMGALGKMGALVAGAFAVDRVMAFATNILRATSETQKFTVQLTGALGSAQEAARVMVMLQKEAAKTPFSVRELTEAYVGFANRGLKPTSEELTNIGDVASFLQKPLSQLKEAMLDVNNSERWTELGIKVKTNGDKISGTFRGVTVEADRTEKGAMEMIKTFGQMEGVAGSMAAQSATINGALSNLGDTMDRLYISIGNRLAPAFNAIVREASSMVSAIADLAEGENNLEKQQTKLAISSRNTANAAEGLLRKYEALTADGVKPTEKSKKELDSITIKLKDTLGESVLAIDKETGAFTLNKEAVREAIKQKLLLANTEASGLALRVESTNKEIAATFTSIKTARQLLETRKQIAAELKKEYDQTGGADLAKTTVAAFDAQTKASRDLETQLNKLDDLQGNRIAILKQLAELGFAAADVEKLFAGTVSKTAEEEKKLGLIQQKRAEIAAINADLEKEQNASRLAGHRQRLSIAEEELKALMGTSKAEEAATGKIEIIQKRIADLNEKRIKARTEAEIIAYDKRIALAEAELDRLNNLYSGPPITYKVNVEINQEGQLQALKDLQVLDKELAQKRASEKADMFAREGEVWQLYLDQGYNKEIQALNASLKAGEITRKQYNERRKDLDDNALRAMFEGEVRTAENILKIADLSADERLAAERLLVNAKKDLYDLDAENFGAAEAQKMQAVKDSARAGAEALVALVNMAFDKEREQAEQRLSQLQADRDHELTLAGDTAGAKEKIQLEFNKREAQLRKEQAEMARKQAIFNKALAVGDIAVNTATAVTSVLKTGGGTYFADFGISAGVLTAFVLAMGAAQAAAVIAQPIPKYAKGTRRVEGGESGKDSVHALLMPNEGVMPVKQNLAYDRVLNAIFEEKIPATVLNTFAANYEMGARFRPQIAPVVVEAKEPVDHTDKILDALSRQPRHITNFDEEGVSVWVEKKGNRERRLNDRYKLD